MIGYGDYKCVPPHPVDFLKEFSTFEIINNQDVSLSTNLSIHKKVSM